MERKWLHLSDLDHYNCVAWWRSGCCCCPTIRRSGPGVTPRSPWIWKRMHVDSCSFMVQHTCTEVFSGINFKKELSFNKLLFYRKTNVSSRLRPDVGFCSGASVDRCWAKNLKRTKAPWPWTRHKLVLLFKDAKLHLYFLSWSGGAFVLILHQCSEDWNGPALSSQFNLSS